MLIKKRLWVIVGGVAIALLVSLDNAQAQCMHGGGGGRPTGSTSALAMMPGSDGYPSNGLGMSGYPSSPAMAFNNYQQQVLQAQYQHYVLANQLAAIQSQKRTAYEEKMLPIRMARAEATRAKRAERTAAIKAKNEAESMKVDSNRYQLASTSP